MKKSRMAMIGAALLAFVASAALAEAPMSELDKLFSTPLKDKDVAVMFLSFSGVVVRTAGGTFVIDPANLLVEADIAMLKKNGLKAVLYTHGHGDHLDVATAKAIVRETGAVVVAEPAVAATLKSAGGIPADKLIVAVGGGDVQAAGLTVRGFVGKHIGPIMLFRVQAGPVGFFHGGDSAYVPIQDGKSDLAFLPTGSPSPTASADSAFKMAKDVKPKVALLMHGSDAQHAAFKKLAAGFLPDMTVEVMEPFKVKVFGL